MIRKLLFLLFLATPLFAQDATLFIEKIEVRNHKRVSPHVVTSESRLYEGRAYTEADLRDAATRLSRLPFLLSVDFSLEKGSERGRYVLVLTIQETKPFFFLIDAVPFYENSSQTPPFEHDDRPGATDDDLVLGFRWFVGRRGAVHAGFAGIGTERAFTSHYAAFSVGYTQYDLFNTRAFATINLKLPVEGYGEGLLSPQVVLGIPLSVNQTLSLEYDDTRFAGETVNFGGIDVDRQLGQRVASMRWSYNTTNDPFFPTRGTLLSVAPHYAWVDGVVPPIVTVPPLPEPEHSRAFHARTYGVRASATQFSEITERSSVWADLRGEWAYTTQRRYYYADPEGNASMLGAGAGYGFSLWSPEERAHGDSRFELAARYTIRPDSEFEEAPYRDLDPVTQASLSWVRRSSWGTLRLGVGYAW